MSFFTQKNTMSTECVRLGSFVCEEKAAITRSARLMSRDSHCLGMLAFFTNHGYQYDYLPVCQNRSAIPIVHWCALIHWSRLAEIEHDRHSATQYHKTFSTVPAPKLFQFAHNFIKASNFGNINYMSSGIHHAKLWQTKANLNLSLLIALPDLT